MRDHLCLPGALPELRPERIPASSSASTPGSIVSAFAGAALREHARLSHVDSDQPKGTIYNSSSRIAAIHAEYQRYWTGFRVWCFLRHACIGDSVGGGKERQQLLSATTGCVTGAQRSHPLLMNSINFGANATAVLHL